MAHTNINSGPTNLFSIPDLASDHTLPPNLFLYPCHSPSVARELMEIAHALVNPRGRGIYATDEAPDVIADMLVDDANKSVKQTEENPKDQRKRWRVDHCPVVGPPSTWPHLLHY
jgi:fructose-bisphosphate aldolase class I